MSSVRELPPPDLTVIYGCMSAGKTRELIRRLKRLQVAGLGVQFFKPAIDNRGEGLTKAQDRDGNEFPAIAIYQPGEVFNHLHSGVRVVAFDETQFLNNSIIPVVNELIDRQRLKVLVAGLLTDFRNEPFGSMPALVFQADRVEQLFAVCTHKDSPDDPTPCAQDATRTQRLINGQPAPWDSPIIQVGGAESYQARCRRHHIVPGRPD